MADDVSMIFFQSGDPATSLDDAARLLADAGLEVTAQAGALTVSWDDEGPALRVVLSDGAHVAVEAAEIAVGTPHLSRMRLCDRRFEIGIEDLDEALDEINTLIEVQATLQDATGGYLFNSWNGELTASGDAE